MYTAPYYFGRFTKQLSAVRMDDIHDIYTNRQGSLDSHRGDLRAGVRKSCRAGKARGSEIKHPASTPWKGRSIARYRQLIIRRICDLSGQNGTGMHSPTVSKSTSQQCHDPINVAYGGDGEVVQNPRKGAQSKPCPSACMEPDSIINPIRIQLSMRPAIGSYAMQS